MPVFANLSSVGMVAGCCSTYCNTNSSAFSVRLSSSSLHWIIYRLIPCSWIIEMMYPSQYFFLMTTVVNCNPLFQFFPSFSHPEICWSRQRRLSYDVWIVSDVFKCETWPQCFIFCITPWSISCRIKVTFDGKNHFYVTIHFYWVR